MMLSIEIQSRKSFVAKAGAQGTLGNWKSHVMCISAVTCFNLATWPTVAVPHLQTRLGRVSELLFGLDNRRHCDLAQLSECLRPSKQVACNRRMTISTTMMLMTFQTTHSAPLVHRDHPRSGRSQRTMWALTKKSRCRSEQEYRT